MNFIFLGPPGAGKGSLAARVSKACNIPHISTGDMFRAAIKAQTPLGIKAKAIIDAGGLVSDEITCALVKERLAQDDCKAGFILDGFPRTIDQAQVLAMIYPNITVVNFVIKDEIVIGRLSTRRVCTKCGANYNIKSVPPKQSGICDICGSKLYQRDDDKPDAIAHRMDVYRKQTEPLIAFYRNKNKLIDIDGDKPTEKILESFIKKFQL